MKLVKAVHDGGKPFRAAADDHPLDIVRDNHDAVSAHDAESDHSTSLICGNARGAAPFHAS